jgi:hypothetical protein
MEIIVLGFGTCQLGFPPTLGEPKAMIRKLAKWHIALGKMQ